MAGSVIPPIGLGGLSGNKPYLSSHLHTFHPITGQKGDVLIFCIHCGQTFRLAEPGNTNPTWRPVLFKIDGQEYETPYRGTNNE